MLVFAYQGEPSASDSGSAGGNREALLPSDVASDGLEGGGGGELEDHRDCRENSACDAQQKGLRRGALF